MFVVSHDRWLEVGEFDPDTGVLIRRAREAGDADRAVRGLFSTLGGVVVVFFRGATGLSVSLGGRVAPVSRATVSYERSKGRCRLAVADGAGVRAQVEYDAPPWIEEDPTAFVDPEDFDLGLLVFTVAHDERRAVRIFRA